MERQKVYTWGFGDDELQQWPPDLEPVMIAKWPMDAPVVVHARQLAEFEDEVTANPLPDGSLPDTILWLPAGMEVRSGGYFDATVAEGDWAKLGELLACPRQFRMILHAEDVPVRLLGHSPGQFDLEQLGLPEEAKSHLSTCHTCREVFDRTLTSRVEWRERLGHPSAERLAAYTRNPSDTELERHFEECARCRNQVEVVRAWIARQGKVIAAQANPQPSKWLSFSMRNVAPERSSNMANKVRHNLDMVQALANGLLGQHWRLRGAGTTIRGEHSPGAPATGSGPMQQAETTELLQQILAGQAIELVAPGKEIRVTWDEEHQGLVIRLLGSGKKPIESFQFEARRGDEVAFEAASKEGRLLVPLAEILQAIEMGLDEIVIRT